MAGRRRPSPRGASAAGLLVIAGAVLWGTTGTAQALAPPDAAPTTVGLLRVLVGGALLALVAACRADGRPRPSARPALFVAAASVVAYQLTFFPGVRAAGVAVGTLVTLATAPVVAGLLQWLSGRQRPRRAWYVATLLAVIGTALLVGATPGQIAGPPGAVVTVGGRAPAVGIALAVGAGVSFAVLTVAGKRLLDDGWSPVTAMGGAFGLAAAGAAIWLLPAMLVGPRSTWTDLGWVAGPRGAAVAVWLGAATAAAAYLLYAAGLRRLEPPTVTTLSMAEPLTAASLGVVVLGERLAPPAVVGAGLVLCGLVVLAGAPLLASRRRAAAEDPARLSTGGGGS